MGRISGLSHVGVFVNDLEAMTRFYCETLGFTESHRNEGRMVFLTADIDNEDHEVVLVTGRDGDSKIIQQLSFRVKSVEDVRAFYQTFKREDIPIHRTASHGAGVSCYFFDPEGNRVELYYSTGFPVPQPLSELVDIHASNEELLEIARAAIPKE